MKPRLLPFLYSLLLLAGLLTACNPSGKDNQQLASVEQLLDSGRVDTACAVLDGVRLNRLTTPADSAYYYLLKTQADYRTNHPLVSLDDIEYSIRYYEGKGSEKLRLSASLFYKSAILYTHGNFKEGVLCLERARTIADQTQDAVLRHGHGHALGGGFQCQYFQRASPPVMVMMRSFSPEPRAISTHRVSSGSASLTRSDHSTAHTPPRVR